MLPYIYPPCALVLASWAQPAAETVGLSPKRHGSWHPSSLTPQSSGRCGGAGPTTSVRDVARIISDLVAVVPTQHSYVCE
jgi:hypothetical protein